LDFKLIFKTAKNPLQSNPQTFLCPFHMQAKISHTSLMINSVQVYLSEDAHIPLLPPTLSQIRKLYKSSVSLGNKEEQNEFPSVITAQIKRILN